MLHNRTDEAHFAIVPFLLAVCKAQITASPSVSFCHVQMDCKAVLSWWGDSGKFKFPYLAPVAQQVFGNQATAAQVKRDLSACGNLRVPNRSRIDSY